MNIEQIVSLGRLIPLVEGIENKLCRVVSAAEIIYELGDKDVDYDCPNSVIDALSEEFISKLPFIIQKVVSDESLLPLEFQNSLEKKKYRVNGEVWVVHKNDVDPFPSSPHAHNYDENIVMHLGNGRLYRKRDYVGTARTKQFLALRNLINNVDLPPLEIEP
ncbi:hypothetical protein [Vibrio cholerae]|uniref:hypothetical protein n=1 Tax=Vibrio cholerae TaxID=666 RepID=UPI000F3CDFBC|nr:hypothetical protein [Vibrio cholerae]RNE70745.1 hypothetical protein EEJ37_00960 [Vibrio cholerae]